MDKREGERKRRNIWGRGEYEKTGGERENEET
jgi:hypothetical protein